MIFHDGADFAARKTIWHAFGVEMPPNFSGRKATIIHAAKPIPNYWLKGNRAVVTLRLRFDWRKKCQAIGKWGVVLPSPSSILSLDINGPKP
jgi:hypothetical protein